MSLIAHIQQTRFLLSIERGRRNSSRSVARSPNRFERTPFRRKQSAAVVAAQPAAPAAKPGEPTDRMLAAILPAGGQAWFFKVVGPIPAIDKHEKEINDFFTDRPRCR